MSERVSIADRLRQGATGHPYAKIPWPHRLLHDAAGHIEELEAERDALKADRERLEWLLLDLQIDEINGTDIHDAALDIAEVRGRHEAYQADYLLAYRRALDAARAGQEGSHD